MTVIAPRLSPTLTARDGSGPPSDGPEQGAALIVHTLRGEGFDASEDGTGRGIPLVTAFDARQSDVCLYGERAGPLDTDGFSQALVTGYRVRRLTPRECERLQGFPDDWTLVPCGRGAMSDSARYRLIGNSMAVPVIRWIGERIERAPPE